MFRATFHPCIWGWVDRAETVSSKRASLSACGCMWHETPVRLGGTLYVYSLQHNPVKVLHLYVTAPPRGRQSSYRFTAITARSHVTVTFTCYSTLPLCKVAPSSGPTGLLALPPYHEAVAHDFVVTHCLQRRAGVVCDVPKANSSPVSQYNAKNAV